MLKNLTVRLLSLTLATLFLFIGVAQAQSDFSFGVETEDFSLNVGGDQDKPGCRGQDCLKVPDPKEYPSITAQTEFRTSLITWTNFFLGFLALIAMIALIAAGFLYVTAGGGQEQTDKAKKIVIYVVVGIIVILLAYALVNTLITTGPKGQDF